MRTLINRIQNNCKKTVSSVLLNEDAAQAVETYVLMNLLGLKGINPIDSLYIAFAVAILIRIAKTPLLQERKRLFLAKMFIKS